MCSFQHKWASERQLYLFVLLHHAGSDPEFFEGGGLSNMVYAHCKVKSVRGGALKQNFMDNNTRSVSLSLAVTPALSG